MKKTLVLLIGLALAGIAQAQIKCWTDADGKRACGDVPPPGAKVTTLKVPSASDAPPPSAKDAGKDGAKAVRKGPLTPAEQEQEYRKREAESQKASAKAAEEQRNAEAKRTNCARARQALADLQSGQRLAQINPATGERYYLDESQIARDVGRVRAEIQSVCN